MSLKALNEKEVDCERGFNPCCNGMSLKEYTNALPVENMKCFNPCCNGMSLKGNYVS